MIDWHFWASVALIVGLWEMAKSMLAAAVDLAAWLWRTAPRAWRWLTAEPERCGHTADGSLCENCESWWATR